ncbi:MAG: 4Fe-4S dicluster domain-containing protein [Cyclobacteriaceae bacterium]|nr:4Fe-4S dicluster domain-containing protein [Cyclobacteriaceae bacterium]
MNTGHLLSRERWEEAVEGLIRDYKIYAPVNLWGHMDYERINPENVKQIVYNFPRPITPLKTFFLPVKQNVSQSTVNEKMVILGVPSCDLQALHLLDAIYLDEKLPDTVYKKRRENTILIGSDCHQTLDSCHCTTYGINPYPESNIDILLNLIGDKIILEAHTEKGQDLVNNILSLVKSSAVEENTRQEILAAREKTKAELFNRNKNLPDYMTTGKLIRETNGTIWKKYAEDCVSCGACAASCPTCSCFLLIDRPGFEKIRNLDTCQYPGFERVAAGEDPLKPLSQRFKNRYMCKYVWKPVRYDAVACTGCGRCIDACIGRINKNELIVELMDKVTV